MPSSNLRDDLSACAPIRELSPALLHARSQSRSDLNARIGKSLHGIVDWIRSRDYSGYEPFDLMNSPYVGPWARRLPFSLFIRHFGRRIAGLDTRRFLRVPPSKNCKALGLMIAGYCDLLRNGEEWGSELRYLKSELQRLRSPDELEFCWGYDWDAVSMRAGNVMPAFSPNAVASSFCGSALLDMADLLNDREAFDMAHSAGRFFANRLNRSVDTADEVCFSYSPGDRTRIYNSSALVAGFLTRLWRCIGDDEYLSLARRSMRYLINRQRRDGAWCYGEATRQRWIDSFHTGYNLEALLGYRQLTGEGFVDAAIERGYTYYTRTFFREGAPAYYHDRLYPIDIHSCSQAILTSCAFEQKDGQALKRAMAVAEWTLNNMQAEDGSFYYQRHRTWTNRTPYLRWGQAWMFRALARLRRSVVGTLN
jgi:hypothetical protein